VDIFVSQVSQFLQTLDISAVGQIFNIDSTGALVADSTGESMFSDSTGTGQLNRISGQDSKSAIIRESSQFLLKKYGAFQNIPPGLQQLELTINGEKQFLQLLPINDQYGLQWVVAVVVPESAYMAQITHNNDVTFEIVIAALAIVFIINITTTERIIRRVSQLNHFAQAIAKGQWNHDHLPLSKINELDSLATSFHQMHSQLYQTLKNLTVEIDERKRVEHILRQSEGYLRSLVDSQATFTIRINMKGNISYCNERYATQFQWLEPSLIGATVLNMILAEDHEKMQQGIIQCESCVGTPVQVELRQLTPNDSQFWTHWELMAVPDSEGVVTEIQCVGIDITQQKLAEAELQALNASLEQRVIDRTFELEQTKNRLEAIFNHSDYGIVLVNVQDGIQQANLAFETLFGATRDGYLGAKLSTFVEADYVTLIESNVQKVAALRQVQRLELLGKRCDSLSFEIEISLAPISHFEEAVTNLVCIIHDISERKKSEIALRASEERFRRFIEMAPIAVVAANQDGELVLSNHETEALFGYAPDELSGQPMEVLIPEKAQVVYSDHQTNFMAGSETHRKQSLELAGQRKDGSKFPVDIKLTHVDLPEGSLELAYIVDITQQKMAETALKQALAHEKELGDFKTRFISIASHEFRTPLATILATTETLTFYRDKLDDAKINDRLDKIKQQVRHLTHIMEDVLQLSKMQAKRVQYKPIQGDLAALCGDIVEEFEVQAQYRGRILYEFTTRSVLLKYDVHLMRQIIGNLISNALKYSPAEKNIYITLAHDSTDVTLKVRDEGIGIPPNDLNHLFEAFHRASNVGTISGTGLGLSITKQAIELHKGTITVESQVGIGTTFIVTIPKPVD
jgi:PAS domain S-box-containing protein